MDRSPVSNIEKAASLSMIRMVTEFSLMAERFQYFSLGAILIDWST